MAPYEEKKIRKSGIPSKIIKHAKKKSNTYNEEKSQSVELDLEFIQMIELGDKNSKLSFIYFGSYWKH